MQVLSTSIPGEMEEKRRANAIVSKIDKGTLTLCSPKSLPDVTPPTRSHIPQVEMTSLRHPLGEIKPSEKTAAEQQAYHIVVSEDSGKASLDFKFSEAIEMAEVKCLDNDVMIR